MLSGKSVTVHSNSPADLVDALVSRLTVLTGSRKDGIYAMHGSAYLQGQHTLQQHNLQEGSTLCVWARDELPGGGDETETAALVGPDPGAAPQAQASLEAALTSLSGGEVVIEMADQLPTSPVQSLQDALLSTAVTPAVAPVAAHVAAPAAVPAEAPESMTLQNGYQEGTAMEPAGKLRQQSSQL